MSVITRITRLLGLTISLQDAILSNCDCPLRAI